MVVLCIFLVILHLYVVIVSLLWLFCVSMCHFACLAGYFCYIHTVHKSSYSFPTLFGGAKEIFLIELYADYKIKNKKVKGLPGV